ncbi:LLM class flavin-dependent oxidoreductase [Frondihabitans australicus]|uniref:Alkanesulfonate monooxygenase SsuD/methylene tetrahydromethanopterin reductase-like flavin-dependent oxidoreductase (Luciferase family) n=1 Tax=Frondihabitans australicus TaxID=386892 RepID=A0A495IL26_9MICO|nr:LLM class flavin-dependent oxidoreductase [Frondihabitans australicus]RKR76687.1 alkanesulfonate monooxygenase SsuD/methylene tetrahydromethanopterin reductase-like flavin-dependent oxidoreductase (luciferase family) [Frondihabitans australicus]
MKRIGFLSFGNYQPVPGSQTRTARDVLTQTIELAVAAEEIGIDNASVRVHHFARQLSSPFPLLAAMAARTSRIELGTGVIDMRYENPLYMAEEAAATDLISDSRLQLGVSRGSPETALHGYESFGYVPGEGQTDADMARQHTAVFLRAIEGVAVARANPTMTGGQTGGLWTMPQSETLRERIWWGSGTRATAKWAAEQGMNMQSSTLLTEDTGDSFADLQAGQIEVFRDAWKAAGWERTPRVSVSRSVMPITTDIDRMYFGGRGDDEDQVGYIGDELARFGKTYAGEPDVLAEQLAADAAVQSADTLLLTVPNQLGVDYNARLLQTVADHIAPALGWSPNLPTLQGAGSGAPTA